MLRIGRALRFLHSLRSVEMTERGVAGMTKGRNGNDENGLCMDGMTIKE